MSDEERRVLFISHANPEDNTFTLWLGARLSAAGYEVWADVLRLRGGHDWQRRLENALRNKAFKVLLVGTAVGIQKQGVRNEIQIPTDTGRKIGDKDFIIPLRLEPFDAPFLIAHAQYIDFRRGWGAGLAEVLETIETEYRAPRTVGPNSDSIERWKGAYQHRAQAIIREPENLISTWLPVRRWPVALHYYDFHNPIDHSRVKRVLDAVRCPLYPHRRGFLGFGGLDDYAEDLEAAYAVKINGEAITNQLLTTGDHNLGLNLQLARNVVSYLISRGWDRMMKAKGLKPHDYANQTKAWWMPDGLLESEMVSFRWKDGPQGRRNLLGEFRDMRWHLGLSARMWFVPEPHIRLIPRVIFTKDGATTLDDDRQAHRLRRSVARDRRNAKWRDMLLAFAFWLSGGKSALTIPLGSVASLDVDMPPLRMRSPVSIAAPGDIAGGEVDPEQGDVVFERDDDSDEAAADTPEGEDGD